jgi:hypothetical protein
MEEKNTDQIKKWWTKELYERLTELEKKVLRWSTDFETSEHHYLEKKINEIFDVLWDKYDALGDFVFENFSQKKTDFDLTPTTAKRLLKNSELKAEKNLELFLRYLNEAYNVYGCLLSIEKTGDDLCERGFHHRGCCIRNLLFKINGEKTTKIIRENRGPILLTCTNPQVHGRSLPKIKLHSTIIEINDITNKSTIRKGLCSQMMGILKETPSTIPTVIKYSHKDYGKRLLVSFPEDVSITELSKSYLKNISKIHNDFYQKEFRGAPESSTYKRNLILDVLEEYKGKRFSINKLCQLASEKLKQKEEISLSPSTIRRHYLKEIKGIKEAKIADNFC